MKLYKLTSGEGYASFGCIWKKGECRSDSSFLLKNSEGQSIPVQSRVTAFWPDGSVKWTAHTADASLMGKEAEITVSEGGAPDALSDGISVTETEREFTVYNGCVTVTIEKDGKHIFKSIEKNGRITAREAVPVLMLEEPFETQGYKARFDHTYEGVSDHVEIEEAGSLQYIFKFTGSHVDKDGNKKLPFIIRMKVQYMCETLQFTHTFVYDGDENKDFLKGLGISFKKPMSGPLYNRHIKVTSDHGVFHEGVITLCSWKPRVPEGFAEAQIRGDVLKPEGQALTDMEKIIEATPYWDTYDVCQDSADHFAVRKKLAGDDLCYIDSFHGNRTKGALSFGSEGGCVCAGIRDFWEKYPSGYTVSGLSEDEAECIVWLWSPSAPVMDFRHYARRGYNSICYEGYDYKGADPYGVACTNEFCLEFFDDMIVQDSVLTAYADKYNDPAVYVGSPEFYHEMGAFGYWSLPDTSTEVGKWIEDQLDKAFKFYENEVEQRKWYGMFNYGDFMHTYDPARHVWRYDVGGYAWDNTELVPTLWLWLFFIRTGRADVYRLAEKLSRHTSEVDVYHIGKYKGMGSRHNVRHWGCPCKEARIAMAGHHRIFYFLTGDRRLEDIFDELKDNEETFLNRDPLGDFYDKAQMVYPSHARSGPDWSSLCSNWMMQWERFNDEAYKNKIIVGSDDIKAAPMKLISGPDFEFDPKSLHLRYIGERTTGGVHLQICMGAPEIWMEMADLLDDDEWRDMLAEYGRVYFLPKEEQRAYHDGMVGRREFTFPMFAAALGAYSAARRKDDVLSKRVSGILLAALMTSENTEGFKARTLKNTAGLEELSEIPWISTNFTAQICLNLIVALDFIRDKLPDTMEEAKELVGPAGKTIFGRA
ncbi:MAG: hypothetical protein IKS11_02825 [Lachnospiraceae bacterium]|nr:hypothetical protein [Lachnospiraceae bacterium]